jgi:hypothetical protein
MRRMFSAPFAEFFQFQSIRMNFLVFMGVIINPFANRALKFD